MIFPQPIMRLKPLTEMGIPEATLMRIYRTRGQKVAKKITPGKRNSPLVFDTAELDKALREEMKVENRSIMRGGVPCGGRKNV